VENDFLEKVILEKDTPSNTCPSLIGCPLMSVTLISNKYTIRIVWLIEVITLNVV
jgi:hypothetical protein